ncbi:MAG TPA: phosphoribosylanthranilate isomerase [Rhodobacteraceae bacterium]|nr:phosphoribosylanthranilate isomerase [Paracoccaceae bacterium]
MSDIQVKICGLSTPEQVSWAVEAGARYVGFNFFAKSPRYVELGTAAELAVEVPPGIAKVTLVVDPDDATLDAILARVPTDMIQLHGQESPARVAEIRARHGLPVMKAIGIADAGDVAKLAAYSPVADQLLVDAKPPKGAPLPGGTGVAFDWGLLQGYRFQRPWMLAGGLTPENVAAAVKLTGARQVDVSSGVETAPGVKDEARIRAFLRAVA